MRALAAIVLGIAFVAGGTWAVIRHLPDDAQAEPTREVRPQEIQSVSLDGRDLPLAALRELLATRAGNLIDLDLLERDRLALADALVARGYLAAQVATPRVTYGAGGAVYVTFAITQGPLFRIRSVSVTGAAASDAGVVTLGGGEIADATRIALARQALEARLRVRGKHSLVVAKLAPDTNAALVDVVLSAAR